MSALSEIRIVLSHPSHPGNIGAAARVMKNMGLSQLYLVNPADFPCAEATSLASGADDILAKSVVVNDLDTALVGSQLVVASSARLRNMPWPLKSIRTLAPMMVSQAATTGVALIFGNEQSGLSNDELARAHYHCTIDTNPAFSSMNLASAVQICCYELRVAAYGEGVVEQVRQNLAAAEQQAQLMQHLEQSLIDIGYLNPQNPGKLMHRLRRLLNRAQLEVEEVNILRGICKAMSKQA